MPTNIFDMSDTWNSGATVFNAIRMNVTNTAAAAGSKILDLLNNNLSEFAVHPAGGITIGAPAGGPKGAGTVNAGAYYINGTPISQSFLPLTGGTLTGDLTIQKTQPALGFVPSAGSAALFYSANQTGEFRWQFIINDGAPETGGNAGSNFRLDRYGDGGVFLGTPISIGRQDGVVVIKNAAFQGTPSITLQFNPGSPSVVTSQTMAGLTRWLVALGDSAPESGANTGSNFAINRYDDGGNFLATVMTINRATGAVVINNLGGYQPIDGDLTSLAAASATNAIYHRSAANTWGPITIGAGLTFIAGTLAATGGGGGVPEPPNDGILYGRRTSGGTSAWIQAQGVDADLSSIAAFGGTNQWLYRSAADTWSPVTIGANLTFVGGTLSATGGGGGGDVTQAGNNTFTGANAFLGSGTIFNPGQVIIGSGAASGADTFQLHSVANLSPLALSYWANDALSFNMSFRRSRGTTVGSPTVVQTGDRIGNIQFQAIDGSAFVTAASIQTYVDGAVAANSVPGRIEFLTRPTSGGQLTRLLIDSGGVTRAMGVVSIEPVAGNATLVLAKPVAGNANTILGRTGAIPRWAMYLGNATAEAGSNAGSDFILERYTDAGAVIGNALQILRSSGGMITASAVTTGGNVQAFVNGGTDGILIGGIGTQSRIQSIGTNPDSPIYYSTKGSGPHFWYTNSFGNAQFAVVHQTTAGYIQFNGGDGLPNLQMQGGSSGNRIGIHNCNMTGITNILGTADATNAPAGNVGEYMSSGVAETAVQGINAAALQNLQTLTLTAGDWEVSVNGTVRNTNAVANGITFTLTTVANNLDQTAGRSCYVTTPATSTYLANFSMTTRHNFGGTVNIYLAGQCTQPAVWWGNFSARRVR